MPNVRVLPVAPTPAPVQLVLGLPVGIERPKRKRTRRRPWMPAPVGRAA